MMSDRPVSLRLGIRSDTATLPGQSDQANNGEQSRTDVDPQLLERFAQAFGSDVDRPDSGAVGAGLRTDSAAGLANTSGSARLGTTMRSPFDLFKRQESLADGGPSAQASGGAASQPPDASQSPGLGSTEPWGAISELIDQMLISDGSDGRRAVRVSLADESIPEVTASVYEEAGAWVADFECGIEASYRRLADPSQTMAERMAAELGHEAIWLVRAPALGLPDVMARALPHGVTESNPRDAAHRLPNAQIGSDFFEGKAR